MSGDDEIEAMKTIAAALEPLDDAARLRALQWATSRFRASGAALELRGELSARPYEISPERQANGPYETFADLFEAARPNTEKDKALVAAYWVQVCQESGNFMAQSLNAQLKDLGHGIGNITEALNQLRDERPALVLQLKKGGTSRQARKTYKLTVEGAKRVRLMTQDEEEKDK
jgi:hypothetical protein